MKQSRMGGKAKQIKANQSRQDQTCQLCPTSASASSLILFVYDRLPHCHILTGLESESTFPEKKSEFQPKFLWRKHLQCTAHVLNVLRIAVPLMDMLV